MRQKNGGLREDSVASQSSLLGQVPPSDNRNPHGAIGNDPSNGKRKESKDNGVPDAQDPLAGVPPADRFGLKGLRHMMSAHPDFQSFLTGVDPSALGIDLNANEYVFAKLAMKRRMTDDVGRLISASIWSPFSNESPRPSMPKFRLPECYQVNNVQPIENKIGSFNEETLMWIFYSCPGDVKQQLAAIEL